MSDIHGCFYEFLAMLDKINFSEKDTLYVLGDYVDRGLYPFELLFDVMNRPNVVSIYGNHDYRFFKIISCMPENADIDNFMQYLDDECQGFIAPYLEYGGYITLEKFFELTTIEKKEITKFLSTFLPYKELELANGSFILTHSGLKNFDPEKPLDYYNIQDFIWDRSPIETTYYNTKILIFGHTPTFYYKTTEPGKILKTNTFINVDCGCVYGKPKGSLGCLALDTMEEYYIESP
jgi:serine/threonine protein phosphatase 1